MLQIELFMGEEFRQYTFIMFLDQYGLGYVSTWNFETWNEPRKNGDFDGLKVTLQGMVLL